MSLWSLFSIVISCSHCTLLHINFHSHSLIVKWFISVSFFEMYCSKQHVKSFYNLPDSEHQNKCFVLKLLPKALNVATCSHMLLGWSGRGCHTRASTSCRRQRQGISEGLTSTVNRYWWLLRFTWRDAHRRDSCRCELKFAFRFCHSSFLAV